MGMWTWTRTNQQMPPKGRPIIWIDSAGNEVRGHFEGGAVWFPDGSSMYIYYTPDLWRLAE